MTLTLCLYLYLCLIALFLPSQQFFIVVELNRTRYGVKFLNENLIFCPLQDEPSSIQHSTRETQLHPGGKSGPFYNPDDSRMKLQEGYYQNPSITTEQTILSDSVNLERIESLDSINLSNLPYPTIIEDNLQPTYLPEHFDFFHPSYIPHIGEFDDRRTSFSGMHHTHVDTTIV